MRALVVAEHRDATVNGDALGLLAKAATLGPVAAVVFGDDAADVAAQVARQAVEVVFAVEDPAFAAPLPQPRAAAVAELAGVWAADAVLLHTTVLAADVAGALAVRLESGVNWDVVDLEVDDGQLVGVQAALEDSVRVRCGWTSGTAVALVRPGSFAAGPAGEPGRVEPFAPSAAARRQCGAALVERRPGAPGSALASADVVVAGGRGLGAPEAFALLEELAGLLDGAVAATRPVVDAGWYPYASQVGQTGRVVAPRLYLACGISGAVQHKVGMSGSQTIVAINSDPQAPIFSYSDVAVVADLHALLPRVIELLREPGDA